jgi:hypothetical protein
LSEEGQLDLVTVVEAIWALLVTFSNFGVKTNCCVRITRSSPKYITDDPEIPS